jgi:heat shock protein HtpX
MESSMMALGINGKKGFSQWFMSHPPLEQRIKALS